MVSVFIVCIFPKSLVFYCGSSCQTAFSGNNFDFGNSTSIEVRRPVSKYHNTLKDSEGVSKLKGMPGSTTIKQTARKYY